jgi:hypothetical protein
MAEKKATLKNIDIPEGWTTTVCVKCERTAADGTVLEAV